MRYRVAFVVGAGCWAFVLKWVLLDAILRGRWAAMGVLVVPTLLVPVALAWARRRRVAEGEAMLAEIRAAREARAARDPREP
ncbi:hypothetical protein R8Z50_12595 [Longispora sp. K20-0274]|uniref:hypothetical protein n=1 Tax=Longispora sp. K20-0274 TaxID=3088255 RepID=UPI00399A58D1